MRPECKVAIVMGVSDPRADRFRRHSMILVPLDTAGVTIGRSTTVFGYDDGDHGGHAVINLTTCGCHGRTCSARRAAPSPARSCAVTLRADRHAR
jgi:hypothetical protein